MFVVVRAVWIQNGCYKYPLISGECDDQQSVLVSLHCGPDFKVSIASVLISKVS